MPRWPAKPKNGEPPAKKPKEEVKEEVMPMGCGEEATGSMTYHVKGMIMPEQLLPRTSRQCEYCEFTTMTEDKLNSHREQKHKIFLCRFCKAEWSSRFEQHKHFANCDKLLEMRKKVRNQIGHNHNKNETHDAIRCMHTKVKCPICKVVYDSMFQLGDHRKHPCKSYAVRLFACNGCKTQFTTANGLKTHLITKYNEKDFKCFNTGILSYESMKIPKYTRRGTHIYEELHTNTAVTLRLVPIKNEPTVPDEMHDDRTKHALVAAHLLSDHDGTMTTEYYFAMRKMFYRVDCPFCGIQCRTHAALHSHGLMHHSPHERCFYQCGGCELTYQTPTGLGQHLKREFDNTNSRCYNTVNLVRKQDYLGPVTGWNKKIKSAGKTVFLPRTGDEMFPKTTDVKLEPEFDFEEDVVKKEEPDDGYELAGPSNPTFDQLLPRANSSSSPAPHFMAGDEVKLESEVKLEPEDDVNAFPDVFLSQ